MTPPPRLVPDRPSDADRESMKFLAYRLHQMQPLGFCRDTLNDAASWLERFAAAPPAEAPAERGDSPRDVSWWVRRLKEQEAITDRIAGERDAALARLAAAPAAPAEGDAFGFVLRDKASGDVYADRFCVGEPQDDETDEAEWMPVYTAPRVTGGRDCGGDSCDCRSYCIQAATGGEVGDA